MVKKKSAGEYNAIPYMCQLLCRTLWVFYGILSPDGLLIITVNSVGVLTQIIYVLIYLIYAPCHKKVKAFIFVSIMNIIFPGVAIALSLIVLHGDARNTLIGYLCAVVTIVMYASPLSIMITVIRTKSVEYMPFLLSFFLLLNAGAWFAFAMFLQDPYLIVPNVVGLASGSAQLIIYIIYKNKPSKVMNSSVEMIEVYVEAAEEGIHKSDSTKRTCISEPAPILSKGSSFKKIMRNLSLNNQSESHSGYLLVPC
ncbi:hypothetical protein HAX54_041420 [Datura stramonium]|uniref:Bidirectional sugar transporter SWEET n=1 Tax=Datura stramonium TaxID=4076 RepID=A0ABS8VP42_DATST|nr:hypothetical protein [Datura stramonium]